MKDIKKAYKALQYIVHKNDYLIPQQPYAPETVRQKLHETLIQRNRTKTEKQITKEIKALISNKNPLYLQFNEQFKRQTDNYKKNKKIYEEMYLTPLKILQQSRPFPYFVKKMFGESQAKNQKTTMIQISNKWNSLNDEDKKNIETEAESDRQNKINTYNQFVLKHKIPKCCNVYGSLVFLREFCAKSSQDKQLSFADNRDLYEKYNALCAQEKQKYVQKAEIEKQKSERLCTQFLERWNITDEELQHIKHVCKQYEKVKKMVSHVKDIKQKDKRKAFSSSDSDSSSSD